MKKRLLSLLLALSLACSLTACGGSEKTSDSDSKESEASDSAIEVDENLLTMEITIPAEYMTDTTQEDLDATAKESGFKSATKNEDGSVTYVMTKAKHKEFMEEMTAEYKQTLDEMIGSEEYPKFTAIEVNDDFTAFTITTESEELDFNESFSVLAFYMYGALYNNFNGTPVDNVHVDFVNADTGEIISSSDSKDLAESTEATE